MNIEIVDGIVDFDDTINIINDVKHIYVDIEHGTIMFYYDSGDEDIDIVRQRIKDKIVDIRRWIKSHGSNTTVKMSDYNLTEM